MGFFRVRVIVFIFVQICVCVLWDGEGWGARLLPPTIEDLSGGKVSRGDLIDKNNMGIVKEYLSPGIQEAVNQGMVLRIGQQLPPDRVVPEYFRKATERNKGKAILDEDGILFCEKVGNIWPGGLPFTNPKTGREVMANVNYADMCDDYRNYPIKMRFIDASGKHYKTVLMDHRFIYCTSRLQLPPLGVIPGSENILWKRISVITYPLELKGLGQYNVRYYNDVKHHDTGFAYLPAFKRTIRVSATTWQDNVAGSDMTYGDGQGLYEPFSYWRFHLIGKKYLLLPEPDSPFPFYTENREISKKLHFDGGKKWPRLGWCIWPVYVVEATPKIRHIYGKKILHIVAWPYWAPISQAKLTDMYDRQMKLWKFYLSLIGDYDEEALLANEWGLLMPDLQTGHVTQYWNLNYVNKMNWIVGDISLKTLLQIGR